MMLQQTGTGRVSRKYSEFLRAFPDLRSLAEAREKEVLAAWQGLGYNRRALYLKRSAEIILHLHRGRIPRTPEDLTALPGVGTATASAVLAFAFNIPVVFIETNIRRVFLRFFFPDETGITDAQIRPLVEQTLDRINPREWYYALMDYGAKIKRAEGNPNRRSAHYKKQPRFEGSVRQLRGRTIATLLRVSWMTTAGLKAELGEKGKKLAAVLGQLVFEGFLKRRGRSYSIR
jgi:A/G-specific adenine glycosylase